MTNGGRENPSLAPTGIGGGKWVVGPINYGSKTENSRWVSVNCASLVKIEAGRLRIVGESIVVPFWGIEGGETPALNYDSVRESHV